MKANRDWSEIAAFAEKVLWADPNDAEARRALAYAYFKQSEMLYGQRQWRRALRKAESSFEIEESTWALHVIVASSYHCAPEKCIQAARRAVILDPESGEAFKTLARLLNRASVRFFMRLSPGLFTQHVMNIGAVRREALESASRAVALLPDDLQARWIHIQALLSCDEIRGACEAYRAMVSMERALAISWLERVRLRRKAGLSPLGTLVWQILMLVVCFWEASADFVIIVFRSVVTAAKRLIGMR